MQSPFTSAPHSGQRDDLLERLNRAEIWLVRAEASRVLRSGPKRVALAVNWLADGWLYALVAVVLVAYDGNHAVETLRAAVVAVVAAHLIYPWVKSYVARPRPFEWDPSLVSLIRPLDRYSFPSGHCMTAAAALLPVAFAHPMAALPAAAGCLIIAWARLAVAHHYPSDLVAGVLLGLAVSSPLTYWLQS